MYVLCIFKIFLKNIDVKYMHINLSKEFTDFIGNSVKSGFYSNSSEVIREALRRMREEELKKQHYLKLELKKGLNQLENGDKKPYNINSIKKNALNKINKGNHLVKDSVK